MWSVDSSVMEFLQRWIKIFGQKINILKENNVSSFKGVFKTASMLKSK